MKFTEVVVERNYSRLEALEPRRLLATVPPGFVDEPWGGTITRGTAMEFAPDGRLFVLQQTGDVRIIDQTGNLLPEPALTLAVNANLESGLLGPAFDPDFKTNHCIYFYYTTLSSPSVNQISRFVVSGNTIDPASRTEILQLGPGGGVHNGGAIHFGPDGMLYAARGDNGTSSNSQVVTNLLGKMIRIDPSAFVAGDPESVIPPDNPSSFIVRQGGIDVTVTPTGINRAIWAVGLRNPFTFAFHPISGRMHINDVGSAGWEEINDGAPGRNFGWPLTEGDFDPQQFPNFTRPLYSYNRGFTPSGGTVIAGGAFYVSDAPGRFPTLYQDQYFFADNGRGWIGYIDPADAPAPTTHPIFASGAARPVDLKVGPDGALYYLQYGFSGPPGGVRRIVFTAPAVHSTQFVFDGFTLPAAPHRLVYTFNIDVSASLDPADLVLVNLTTGQTVPTANVALLGYDNGTNTATFTFPGFTDGILPDGNYRATLLAAGVTDQQGQPLWQDDVSDFFFLNSDANRDGVVNLADFNILAENFGQTPRDFSEGDFNYDGVVNLADFNILAERFGTSLGGSLAGRAAGVSTPLASSRTPFSSTPIRTGEDEEFQIL